jgi:ATP-dependent exoDNAse (exonuclease V) alpha subunit
MVTRRIPARFGLDPRRDIQVLALMHRGPAGAAALNTVLQQALTPGRPDLPEAASVGEYSGSNLGADRCAPTRYVQVVTVVCSRSGTV